MSKTILCADDSQTMQTVAEITFRASEYEYVGARSADEALQRARAKRPSLILADALMPGKTGYDLCSELKADPELADVPVVLLCGNSEPYNATKGAQVGADGYLTKPWDTQQMLDKVGELLEKFAQQGPSASAASPAGLNSGAAAATTPLPSIPSPAMASRPAAANKPPPTPSATANAQSAAAAAAAQRSATIMGMPTIKMPPSMAKPGMAASPSEPRKPQMTPTPAAQPSSATGDGGMGRGPSASPGVAADRALPTPPAGLPQPPSARAPMISGTPTKRPSLLTAQIAKAASDAMAAAAEQLGIAADSPEMHALLRISLDTVERVVWEVVPSLAEQMIREHLEQLTPKVN